ncbi:hypothetical protein SESBI_16578 [Sesbania bispinosa]|nr:hypothetical protein SESBI_16578 [Sesbania bispinosa]
MPRDFADFPITFSSVRSAGSDEGGAHHLESSALGEPREVEPSDMRSNPILTIIIYHIAEI